MNDETRKILKDKDKVIFRLSQDRAELLEVLKDAIEWADAEKHPSRPWHDRARAIISKAEGEQIMKQSSFSVTIRHKEFGEIKLDNITEIHYRYPSLRGKLGDRIAFESDIDGTGGTYFVDEILEFEAIARAEA